VAKDLFEQLNATVTHREDVGPGLTIIRVESDGDLFAFEAGQYCVLGLPPEAERVEDAHDEEPLPEKKRKQMIRRAYSISSSSKVGEYLEFYITLVHSGGLTPRIFALQPGARIWLGPKATGLFTLKEVPEHANLYLLATGTGLAPYVSMVRSDILYTNHDRKIVIAHGARTSADLGYREELVELAGTSSNLVYIPSITRPATDPSWEGETGYLQDQMSDGRLERISGVPLDPERTQIFLCGNPSMLDAAVLLLEEKGFSEWSRQSPEGQVHLEKYW
jgi:ferredoxin/flavodoxin---NADP+ reductase